MKVYYRIFVLQLYCDILIWEPIKINFETAEEAVKLAETPLVGEFPDNFEERKPFREKNPQIVWENGKAVHPAALSSGYYVAPIYVGPSDKTPVY